MMPNNAVAAAVEENMKAAVVEAVKDVLLMAEEKAAVLISTETLTAKKGVSEEPRNDIVVMLQVIKDQVVQEGKETKTIPQ
jgi:hypothetical protein